MEQKVQCFNKSDKLHVSVIVPTLNEEENIDALIGQLLEAFRSTPYSVEILIADGGSTDGTQAKVEAWTLQAPVRLVHANSGRGLTGDVLVAVRETRGDVVVVMDADLSHPPEMGPKLARLVLEGTYDMTIGSRYVDGGATPGWPWMRRVISRVAGLLAWPLVDVRDPTSGFFSIRREKLLAVDSNAEGFKIALEVLLSGADDLRVKELPILFRDRSRGHSKMCLRQAVIYLRRLIVLAGGAATAGNAMRFALVGLLGLMVDIGMFHVLWNRGLGLSTSHTFSFFVATVLNYTLNSQWAFRSTSGQSLAWGGYAKFLVVCLAALFLRGGVLALLVHRSGWPMEAALVAAVFAAAAVNYIGAAFFVFPRRSERTGNINWGLAAIGLIGYMLMLRLVYLGLPDLLPEEAYYWNYAQHPALGYLDHPPMVAWLITLGTSVFGDSEFGVRIGTFVCWFITAGFCFSFARNLFDKETAFRAVMLVASLPVFFAFGLFMTPDVPLITSWAGALFFLERALLANRQRAWWGVGVCLGLGMLSKYTIVLLGPATMAFVLLDRRSRGWLLRPEPYAAMILALLLFSPVLLWNIENGWVSFVFQTVRRLRGSTGFSLHLLFGSVLLLITPLGALAVTQAISTPRSWSDDVGVSKSAALRRRLFIFAFTLVPLFVFVLFSIRHQPKLNWTGPIWLAILPVLAKQISPVGGLPTFRLKAFTQRLWVLMFAAMMVIYGGILHYASIGLPGVPYRTNTVHPVAWEEMGEKVEQIEDEIEAKTGEEPLVVGMDKYFIASEMAFYRRDRMEGVHEGIEHTCSRNLFGRDGLMYAWWFPDDAQVSRTLVLVSTNTDNLSDDGIAKHVRHLSPVQEVGITKNGAPAGRFFYRIGYGYLGERRKS
jgi:dolichol-phosphate mannosyltransferase